MIFIFLGRLEVLIGRAVALLSGFNVDWVSLSDNVRADYLLICRKIMLFCVADLGNSYRTPGNNEER